MSYFSSARHPFSALLFVLPLLIIYEAGVIYLGGDNPDSLRNGADIWFRWGLERYGITVFWAAPAIVVSILLFRTWWNWPTRPAEVLSTLFGMVIESLLFAVALWLIAKNFQLVFEDWASTANWQFQSPATQQVITYIGAGIYEEVLFRLGLYSVIAFVLTLIFIPKPLAIVVAALASSVCFSAAHHFGQHGEEIHAGRFAFRVVAGLFFTMLYVARGFGIAVGAHAGYDVLIGVTIDEPA